MSNSTNGTTVNYNTKGMITSLSSGNMDVNISYGNDNISAVKIGNTNYTNISEENGKITVKKVLFLTAITEI